MRGGKKSLRWVFRTDVDKLITNRDKRACDVTSYQTEEEK
jgi:hypothetical protein